MPLREQEILLMKLRRRSERRLALRDGLTPQKAEPLQAFHSGSRERLAAGRARSEPINERRRLRSRKTENAGYFTFVRTRPGRGRELVRFENIVPIELVRRA